MGYGVIGSPPDSGSVSLGSSPSTPAQRIRLSCAGFGNLRQSLRATARAPLCSGLARRPLKAVARVRIPSGLPPLNPLLSRGFSCFRRVSDAAARPLGPGPAHYHDLAPPAGEGVSFPPGTHPPL